MPRDGTIDPVAGPPGATPGPGPASTALVAVGSNLDAERHIRSGLRRLHWRAPIEAVSRFYRTPAIGADGLPRAGDPDFTNGAVRLRTRLKPLALRRVLHLVEAEEGCVRTADRHAPRTLDLDLVPFDGRVLDRDLPIRRHLAVPTLEVAPALELVPGTPLRDPGGLRMEPLPGFALDGILAAGGDPLNARPLAAPWPPAPSTASPRS